MTISQDIFKGLGPNWKWASLSSGGRARVHTEEPAIREGVLFPNRKGKWSTRADFSEDVPSAGGIDPVYCARTNFSNGPEYPTDSQGSMLVPPTAEALSDAPAALPPRKCNVFDCDAPALTDDMCCKGHTTQHSKLQVPEAGVPDPLLKPSARHPHAAAIRAEIEKHENWGDQVLGFDEYNKGLANGMEIALAIVELRDPKLKNFAYPKPQDEAIEKAKRHARHLLDCFESDNDRQVLTPAVYIAIFGELPN